MAENDPLDVVVKFAVEVVGQCQSMSLEQSFERFIHEETYSVL